MVFGEINEFVFGVNYWDIFYNGVIDELKIFNGVISVEEIKVFFDVVVV